MTGRSDFGSRPWRFPALLSDAPSIQLRRGTQQDILRALRHLLRPGAPAPASPRQGGLTDRVAPSGGDSGRLNAEPAPLSSAGSYGRVVPSGGDSGRLNGSSGGDSDPRWRRKPEKPASVASTALASGTASTPASGYATGMSRDDDGDVGRGNCTGMATRHHDAQPVQFRSAAYKLARPAVGRQVTRPDATPAGNTAGPGEVSR